MLLTIKQPLYPQQTEFKAKSRPELLRVCSLWCLLELYSWAGTHSYFIKTFSPAWTEEPQAWIYPYMKNLPFDP